MHTKGPWYVFTCDGKIDPWPGIESDSLSIITFGEFGDSHGVRGESEEEALANAHLISAAPDLLEAVRLLLSEWSETNDDIREENRRFARAAIAKAQGRQP